jgi:hypothetical protein
MLESYEDLTLRRTEELTELVVSRMERNKAKALAEAGVKAD